MNLEDFNKSLTGLIEEQEKQPNKKSKNQIIRYMAVEEHGRPFDTKPLTRMAIGEHGRPFDTKSDRNF
jgi:hypothetical protein